jgi:uncharacterized membrane protein YkoI
MENDERTLYAMMLGALAVAVAVGSIATVSFASAQIPNSNETAQAKIVTLNATAAPDMLFQKFAPIPDIKGSVNAGSDLMSKVQVSFSDAAKMAADAASGTVTESYLVYSFRVLSGDQMKTVVVDAGNGQVLYTSEGFPADVMSEISGHGTFFTPGVKAFTVMAKTPSEEARQ